jgi:membrane-bound metal-dependent hydrolase YbcI (DUF457 family)
MNDALNLGLRPQEIAVGAIATAGAALIPDLDHPSATIAYTFGPVSKAAAKLTALLAGGHRQGTHSLLFAGGFGLLCWLVGMSSDIWHTNTPAMIMMFLLSAFAFRGLNLVLPKTSSTFKGIVVIIQAMVLTWFMATYLMPTTSHQSWWWLGIAGAMGCIAHLIGDTLTPEGVPWLYPSRIRISVPIVSHTGNVLERAIIGPLFVVGTAYFAYLYIHSHHLFGF